MWFVMGFPALLLLLFFGTLNFNAKVLYAPSDFQDEENFLNTLLGTSRVSMELEHLTRELADAPKRIDETLKQITTFDLQEREKLAEIVRNQLTGIESRLEGVRAEANTVVSSASGSTFPNSALQSRILGFLTCTAKRVYSAGSL